MEVRRMTGTTTSEAVPTTMAAGRRRAPRGGSPAPASGAVYGLGMIGALVYFLASAKTPADVVLAFGKAIIWPSLLVYRAFKAVGG
jgi:hypothetical protein